MSERSFGNYVTHTTFVISLFIIKMNVVSFEFTLIVKNLEPNGIQVSKLSQNILSSLHNLVLPKNRYLQSFIG